MAQGPKRTCCARQKGLKGSNDKKKVMRNTFTEITHIHISIKELDGVFHPEVAKKKISKRTPKNKRSEEKNNA